MSVPGVVAGFLALTGYAMLVGGVYELIGQGWALLAGSLPLLLVSVVILRGLK